MRAIIFGGSGFVGTHLIQHLEKTGQYDQFINGDLVAPKGDAEQIPYIPTDVRQAIDKAPFARYVDNAEVTIFNLAALCRIPGYPYEDYFETNIRGAQNVCDFADKIGCRTIVFTSSIAVYGPTEEEKNENSLTTPKDPYGMSKLVAEEIHKTWQASGPEKNLHILRPGIIFGAGEGANFTRLYRAIRGHYFIYPGRKDARKACIYVKDLVELCTHYAENMKGLNLVNSVFPQSPTLSEICESIASVLGQRKPGITVPFWSLLALTRIMSGGARLVGKGEFSFNPDRIRKLKNSTNISGRRLAEAGYQLRYSLQVALQDWYESNNENGLF